MAANTSSKTTSKPVTAVKKPPIPAASWSFTDNEPDIKFDHAWSISNFPKKMEMENGEELKSGVFVVKTKDRTTDWFMRINPNGEEKSCKGFVSLFLYKDGVCEVPINTDIIFSIIDKDGAKTRAKRCEYQFDKNLPSDNRGFAKFVSHTELKHPSLNLLPNDQLTILCEISITGDSITHNGTSKPPGRHVKEVKPQNKLAIDMSTIFESGKFADCTINCEGREFHCHKNILSARSTVFDAMFSHDMEENKRGKVDIIDLDADTVYDMIAYIYSEKVPDLSTKAAYLLSAAEKYDLQELKTMCEIALCENIALDNVVELLILADLHSASSVRSLALKFIVDNSREVTAQPGWRDKLRNNPDLMADMFEAISQIPASKKQRIA